MSKSPVVRVAVVSESGMSSNSWRIWINGSDVYIRCRDNFSQFKASLHASGENRLQWDSESLKKDEITLSNGEPRFWDKWVVDRSNLTKPTPIFRLFFHESYLKVPYNVRLQNKGKWKNCKFIQTNATDRYTVISLFLQNEKAELQHESQLSFELQRFSLDDGTTLSAIVHHEPNGTLYANIDQSRNNLLADLNQKNVKIPDTAFGYFTVKLGDSSRAIVGVPML